LLKIWERTRQTVVFITHSLIEAVFLSDVVYVMAAKPGRILDQIEVPIARPRTIDIVDSPEFGALRNRMWHLIADPH